MDTNEPGDPFLPSIRGRTLLPRLAFVDLMEPFPDAFPPPAPGGESLPPAETSLLEAWRKMCVCVCQAGLLQRLPFFTNNDKITHMARQDVL